MKIKLLLGVFCISLSANAQVERALSLLEAWQNKMKPAQEISYKAFHKMKYLSEQDTFPVRGSIVLQRLKSDNIFKGKIWLRSNDAEKIYDGKNFYTSYQKDSGFTIFPGTAENRYNIEGNTSSGLLSTYFLVSPDFKALRKAVQDAHVSDTVWMGMNCWNIELRYKDDGELSRKSRNYFIGKADTLLYGIMFRVNVEEEHQYGFWEFSNYKLSTVASKQIEERVKILPDSFRVKQFVPPPPIESLLLANNSPAPAFSGKELQTDSTLSLANYKGQIVVLDFFFLSCPPCMQAIPELVKLQEEFRKEGVQFLGIDGTDAGKKEQLKKMVNTKQVNYPVLITDSEMANQLYHVRAYPTVYIIDREGRIASSFIGYNEKGAAELRKAIKNMLNN